LSFCLKVGRCGKFGLAANKETSGDIGMVDDYEQYEADSKRIRIANEKLLADFANWLKKSNLAHKTISKHLDNIEFYINEYLLYEDAIEPQDGVHDVSMFLGYWFIRKAMWASAASIKSNAASLKKFYTYLYERGLVTKDDLDSLKETIKEEMSEWLATLDRYDDPSITDMEEVWGL
jgi:intergrase/recombinase